MLKIIAATWAERIARLGSAERLPSADDATASWDRQTLLLPRAGLFPKRDRTSQY